jgi:PhzF family phenazine biosynthesis protein
MTSAPNSMIFYRLSYWLESSLIMLLPVRLYASFAACEGGGNIAGVVYDEVGLEVDRMRRIATELGAPTTGFVRGKSLRDYIVRFFSSCGEMAMCGHVTVGIFACLADDGLISVDGSFYRQRTAAGEICVEVSEQRVGRKLSCTNRCQSSTLSSSTELPSWVLSGSILKRLSRLDRCPLH